MAAQTIGQYEIIRELGRGSMGIVYEAKDTKSELKVALKLLTLSQSITGVDRRQAIDRFKREANAAGSLVHPSVAQVYDTGEFNGNNYMVMEYCSGVTLRHILKHEKRISEDKLKLIMEQLLSALEVAHASNIIHRDIKPDNIMVGPNTKIKLMDFGIAKLVDSSTMTQAGQMMGSPAYMSPEQIMGKPIDATTDLFSTGVTIYECLSGVKPFNADTITGITHQIMYNDPEPLTGVAAYWQGIVLKAMQKEPGSRYADATQMRLDIKNQRAPVIPQIPATSIQNQTIYAPAPPAAQPQQYPPQIPPSQISPPTDGQQYPVYQQPTGPQYYNQPNMNYDPQQLGVPYFQNTSGIGTTSVVPNELRGGWNWGAFFLTLFWSISHNVLIGLIPTGIWLITLLINDPYFNGFSIFLQFILYIMMGLKGNEWAWKYRKWDSIQQFRDTQRVWRDWALGILGVAVTIGFGLGLIASR